MKAKKQSRKKRVLIGTVMFLAVSVIIWWFNTFTLTVHTETIQSEKVNDEITIVHISDLHDASFGKDNKDLIEKIRKQNPDLIAVTGDMHSYGSKKGRKTAFDLMKNLTDIAPVYYVNGEHDMKKDFSDSLRECGVSVLDYKDAAITIKNTALHLYGITNVYYTPTFDLANKFTLDENAYNILLAHLQNFNKFASFGIDLSLCGDTHGGMIRLPFVGAIYTPDSGMFPELSGKYIKGMYEKDGKHLYMSSGLGNYPVPVRFCNRPEIAVIKLQPKK